MGPYLKTIIRSIKQSFGRFIAILSIIALGVGFMSGIVLTSPSMKATGMAFYNDNKFFDFRLLSTIGFSEEDLDSLRLADSSAKVEGAYFTDVFSLIEGQDSDTVSAIRLHSITNDINTLSVTAGRLPENSNEIVLDGYIFDESTIGKTLVLTEDVDATDNVLINHTFEVVGIIRSPLYLSFQRGTCSIGSGRLSYYAYVLPEVFDMEYYPEAYMYFENSPKIYSEEYDSWADTTSDRLETVVDSIIVDRFEELLDEGYEELSDAVVKLDDSRRDGLAELEDARLQLQDARLELDEGLQELENARNQLLSSASQLNSAQQAIDQGLATINQYEERLANSEITMNPLLESVNSSIETAQQTHNQILVQIENARAQGQSSREYFYQSALAANDAWLNQLAAQRESIINGSADAALRAQIEEGRANLVQAQAQLDANRAQYNNGWAQYNEGLEKYNEGLEEYNDGLHQYYEGLHEFEDLIAQANQELDYGYRQLNSIDRPSTYVLGRDTNIGYLSYTSDCDIVAGIARVFPLFFFAIAALVCSTTMQRMVSDERGIIGTMRALGYSDFSIMMKYVIYSGLAAVSGCLIGYVAGIRTFPFIIWDVYGMMYGFADLVLVTSPWLFALAMFASILCSVGVTISTCMGELKDMPATLIRPKAPIPGKKILLERITPLWNHLKFTHKVSIRNVFRFKKRMFMMLIGIAGCSALIITGFGIRDSVASVVDLQFDRITTFDIVAAFEDVALDKALEDVKNASSENGVDLTVVPVRTENVTHVGQDAVRDVTLYISSDSNVEAVIHPMVDGEAMPWPKDNEIAISSKVALKNGLEAGDEITLSRGDMDGEFTLRIAYVFDNYVYHYGFMNERTYERVFNEEYEPSKLLLLSQNGENFDSYAYATSLSNTGDFKNITVTQMNRETFASTMEQMDSIVILVIVCAAILAFIVLFNLNNINITERVREIATIKVLGFTRGETGSYFFRESFILVLMGYVIGIPLGILLHKFVVSQIAMDTVTFPVMINTISYVFALLFVLGFSIIVDMVMRLKIEKIDMAESLKSAE